MMANASKDDERKVRAGKDETAPDSVSTLLPMLVTGLVLIVVSMIVVMNFV